MPRFFVLVLFLGSISLYAGNIFIQESPGEDSLHAFRNFVHYRMSLDKVPGMSIGFCQGNRIWAEGFGYADLENKVSAIPESSYRLASITKTITAMAILMLAEEGKINLDAEVQHYVSPFPLKKWPVTIRNLLGHLGGISHYKNAYEELHIKVHKNTREALDIFKDFELVAEPGTKFNYSSYGFNLLGAVVEEASGRPYGEFIQTFIFKPLGMTHSCLDNPADLIPNRVRGYRIIDGEIKNSEYVDVSSRFAGGGTRSSVVDLLKYAQGIFEGWLLKENTFRMMFTSMSTRNGIRTGYGMGWRVQPWNGHFQVSHGGSQPETRTHILIFPCEKFAIAAATNREGLNLMPYITRLAETVLGEDLDHPAYVTGRAGQAVYNGCRDIYSYGLSQFDWLERSLVEKGEELEKAFSYFTEYTSGDKLKNHFYETREKIQRGIDPVSGSAWIKIGTFMAGQLQKAFGEQKLDSYHKTGPTAFFRDYFELSRSLPAEGRRFLFPDTFEAQLKTWEADWAATHTEDIARLTIRVDSDFSALDRILKQGFTGRRIYPDFCVELSNAARQYFDKGLIQKSEEILNLTLELYPLHPEPHSGLAAVRLWEGDTAAAKRLYDKAREVDPDQEGTSLNEIEFVASKLRDTKKIKALFALAEIAIGLYPENARLQKEVGDMYMQTGQTEKAAECYRKALELEPELKGIQEKLARIEKRKAPEKEKIHESVYR